MKGFPKLSDPWTDRTRLRRRAILWAVGFTWPGVLAVVLLAIAERLPANARIAIGAAGLAGMALMGWWLGKYLIFTLEAVFALLTSLREGDYGLRGHEPRAGSPLQGLVAHMNQLADDLRTGRRKQTEASHLLSKMLVALSSAVFVMDDERRLRLINPAGRRLLGADRVGVIGRRASELGLDTVMAVADDTIMQHPFEATAGRWAVRRAVWHSDGREHTLIMLHDLSAALNEEERRAWQRLLRVLSHELNNSLTPIASLAGSLTAMLETDDHDAKNVLREGLDAIGRRADALARFLSGYGRLAGLPPLQQRVFRLDESLLRLVRLEDRREIQVLGRTPITVRGDEDQLDQAFINLLRNAVEATFETGGAVRLNWWVEVTHIMVRIEDDGVGLPASDGLFVPFFTTKPTGSGIGLSLTRLIVEAHGGQVDLAPGPKGRGAVAKVRLPRSGLDRPPTDNDVRIRTTT
ncbi:ATP-binding protein [Luteibacter aegosomatis]|uniref:sensor histidine kinase n=1 Tax=Luteibacter aegosomatis TaxID=2911537 RepID=UPI001FF9F53B|nr:ATP-binding protein [Luteibacter aegosomatis]UPG85886.1 ATP-binding protein [Luteibacter aegosomatis]